MGKFQSRSKGVVEYSDPIYLSLTPRVLALQSETLKQVQRNALVVSLCMCATSNRSLQDLTCQKLPEFLFVGWCNYPTDCFHLCQLRNESFLCQPMTKTFDWLWQWKRSACWDNSGSFICWRDLAASIHLPRLQELTENPMQWFCRTLASCSSSL